jgi:ferritin
MGNHFRYTIRASWARYRGFEGAGDFFEKEAAGEFGHAKLVRDYIEARNEAVLVAPYNFSDDTEFQYFDELFTTSLQVERDTTERLNAIYLESFKAGDIQTMGFVTQMIVEQTEEENIYQTTIDRIVQRGGGGLQVDAFDAFRQDLSASHDVDVWIAERVED